MTDIKSEIAAILANDFGRHHHINQLAALSEHAAAPSGGEVE